MDGYSHQHDIPKVYVEPEMSMEELYLMAGIKKSAAKIPKLEQEVLDTEVDSYLNALFDGKTGEEAVSIASAASKKRRALDKNREIYKYDKKIEVEDITSNNTTPRTPNKKKYDKEYSFREYVEEPKEKSTCIFKMIWEAIFGKSKENNDCVKLRF
jgi:hypothetical protein